MPPLFCVHPLGGDVRCYYDIARHMPQGRPVFGLRGRGRKGHYGPHLRLDDMVHDYITAMREVQPQGPYFVAGWSAGGIYGYEIARTLRRGGQDVAMLALLDTPLPSIYDGVDVEDPVKFLFDMANFANWFAGADINFRAWSYEQLRSLDQDRLWERALAIAKAHHALPERATADYIRRLVEASRAHARMIMQYRVGAFDQTVHLFRPAIPDVLGKMVGQTLSQDLGWRAILGDDLKLHETPGDHFSMILGENAPRVAAALAALIEQSERTLALASK